MLRDCASRAVIASRTARSWCLYDGQPSATAQRRQPSVRVKPPGHGVGAAPSSCAIISPRYHERSSLFLLAGREGQQLLAAAELVGLSEQLLELADLGQHRCGDRQHHRGAIQPGPPGSIELGGPGHDPRARPPSATDNSVSRWATVSLRELLRSIRVISRRRSKNFDW